MSDRREEIEQQIAVLQAELLELRNADAANAKHREVDVNRMSPELWRSMSQRERSDWSHHWVIHGVLYFCCTSCGFPLASRRDTCDACSLRFAGT